MMKETRHSIAAASRQELPKVLSLPLPSVGQTWLLRACLLVGDEGTRAWTKWLASVQDPIEYVRRERDGVKGLLPLLFAALTERQIDVEKTLWTTLKTALVNEEMRSKSYHRICGNVISAFNEIGIATMVVKGADLAYTVYDRPIYRHTDGLDLMIMDRDAGRVLDLMSTLGYAVLAKPATSDWETARGVHKSGLAITVHRSLFHLPFHIPIEELWLRGGQATVAGAPTRMLSPADNLLFTCVNLYADRNPSPLRWACDGRFIVSRHPDLDWDVLLDFAGRNQLALPLSLTLGYLAEHLSAPVPEEVVNGLTSLARNARFVELEVALYGARRSRRGGFRRMLDAAGDWKTRFLIIRWMFLPSTAYLRWAEGIHRGWALPFYYLVRPLQYVARRIWPASSNGRT